MKQSKLFLGLFHFAIIVARQHGVPTIINTSTKSFTRVPVQVLIIYTVLIRVIIYTMLIQVQYHLHCADTRLSNHLHNANTSTVSFTLC